MRNIVLLFAAFVPLAAFAQDTARPTVPDAIKAPPDQNVILVAHATGSQIYTCAASADGKFAWTLKAPDAELKDAKGKTIGKHFAGPTWKLDDGSEVKAKAAGKVDAPEASAVPWLLLNATSNSGKGALARAATIQRIHTKGGQPSASGCDSEHKDAESRSSYTADYYFFAPK